MNQVKEFQARSLDDAIREACDYFGVPREKLEIEIVSDAKTGIFGLVGAKKATIRAFKRQLPESVSLLAADVAQDDSVAAEAKRAAVEESSGKNRRTRNEKKNVAEKPLSAPLKGSESKPARRPKSGGDPEGRQDRGEKSGEAPDNPSGRRVEEARKPASRPATGGEQATDRQPAEKAFAKPPRNNSRGLTAAARIARESLPPVSADSADDQGDPASTDLPDFDLSVCDQAALSATVSEVVLRLVAPIVGQVPCEVSLGREKIRASLDCGDASGLLVGKEGQTLASVQYLASRIIARKLGGAVRLHVDTGNYRERQEDKLKTLARQLAGKVKKTRRPVTTRPMSAYQRRIIHLALESDPAVTTRSKGEGPERRVMVYPAERDER